MFLRFHYRRGMKNKKNKNAQALSTIVRICGHEFTIDLDGYVSTSQHGDIGHIEDCVEFAALIHSLIETLGEDFDI